MKPPQSPPGLCTCEPRVGLARSVGSWGFDGKGSVRARRSLRNPSSRLADDDGSRGGGRRRPPAGVASRGPGRGRRTRPGSDRAPAPGRRGTTRSPSPAPDGRRRDREPRALRHAHVDRPERRRQRTLQRRRPAGRPGAGVPGDVSRWQEKARGGEAGEGRGQCPRVALVDGVRRGVAGALHALRRHGDRQRRRSRAPAPARRRRRWSRGPGRGSRAACPSPATAAAGTGRASRGRRRAGCRASTPGARWPGRWWRRGPASRGGRRSPRSGWRCGPGCR